MDLIDIYRIFHPKAKEYTFFSSAYETFSKIAHILDHKSSLGRIKKTAGNSRHGSEETTLTSIHEDTSSIPDLVQ